MNQTTDKFSLLDQTAYQRLSRLSIFVILHMTHLLARHVNRELLKMGYTLQVEQIRMLIVIFFMKESPSQQEIADFLQRNKAGIQRSVKTLERDGYLRVTADATDKRKNLVFLSPAGKMVVERALESMEKIDEEIRSHLTDEEMNTMMQVRQKIVNLMSE
ncbi:MarR family winged helix-turn-helix transcriptional regulator [Siphonobacter aquaeclarae]|jgi:DNA-binding MarR family transcriptional regulator|uniref:MarR family transcriptional regulator, repressor for mepA n=1 Tax=Siphonobacter aquaeclarae TaxID=563176 RepID=A0A1G9SYN0_9BACT|nr:MarR family transcriptional regulator [Siphonobacter aquaeclarae]MBO9639902.1 MarR family transcriptional regulator [Siphonobacter aquaeclarae]SDM40520.1 MarR family transcriptional regulator, repressor for mepA [Siphonobacter aquaeclarae]